ncbi:unnamed protein product, partial [marine sediment metagenome]
LKLYDASTDSVSGMPEAWELKGGPYVNYGFLVYFLAFEDVKLTDTSEPWEALTDITPADSLEYVDPDDDIDVAVQVRGFVAYEHTHLAPALSKVSSDPDVYDVRPQKIVDANNDGVPDTVLPEGRWVFPDDWWNMVGNQFDVDPNMDLMDKAHEDGIDSSAQLGPFDSSVRTPKPDPGEAELPCIGPFNTLQRWSAELMWIADADTVPSSHDTYPTRNTVVPDGKMSWWDAPMPQALVSFDITQSTVTTGLSELDKGDLGPKAGMTKGYGYTGVARV